MCSSPAQLWLWVFIVVLGENAGGGAGVMGKADIEDPRWESSQGCTA